MQTLSFQTALTIYAALATLAGFSLTDPLRAVVVLMLAGFAFKTWISQIRDRKAEDEEGSQQGSTNQED